MATNIRVVLVTVPVGPGDEKTSVGEEISRTLVEERLAACVNRIPNLTSTYRWQGKVEVDAEELLVIKTTKERVAKLTARVKELHPYEVPEVLSFSVEEGLEAYLGWISESCK